MVRQTYLYRLALGRSAFEPPETPPGDVQHESGPVVPTNTGNESSNSEYVQLYSSRGHPQNPASRSRVRRNIRAHNEVLAAVDVCARVDAEGKPVLSLKDGSQVSDEQLNSIIDENESGFWLGVEDELLRMLTTTFTTNLRRRIQTFDFYGGIPLTTILKVESLHQGVLQIFLAGQVATTVYALLFGAIAALIGEGREMLVQRFVSDKHRKSQRRLHSTMIDAGVKVLEWSTLCALLPLQTYGTLQRLNLIPLWPLLPNPFSKNFFSIAYPPIPFRRNQQTIVSWMIAFSMSPVVVTLAMQFLGSTVQSTMSRYLRACIPRPDNPDQLTQRMSQIESFDDSLDVSKYPRFQSSFREELQKDIDALKLGFTDLRLKFRNALRKLFIAKRQSVGFDDLTETDEDNNEDSRPLNLVPSQSTAHQAQPALTSPPATTSVATSGPSNNIPDSPSSMPSLSNGHEEPEDGTASNVRIRTRTGSTSTLHLDVEISSSAEVGATVHTSSFAASPYPSAANDFATEESSSAPYHRVTTLSLYAAESMNIRLTGLVLTLARLPLETFYSRVIARNFLRSQDNQHWLLPHVYPLNCWFGIRPPYANIDYASKILLCLGVEAMVSTQVWYLVCKGAYWMGRQWYKWEKL